jgi:hypothetical protein
VFSSLLVRQSVIACKGLLAYVAYVFARLACSGRVLSTAMAMASQTAGGKEFDFAVRTLLAGNTVMASTVESVLYRLIKTFLTHVTHMLEGQRVLIFLM